jgi:hypothetical protein
MERSGRPSNTYAMMPRSAMEGRQAAAAPCTEQVLKQHAIAIRAHHAQHSRRVAAARPVARARAPEDAADPWRAAERIAQLGALRRVCARGRERDQLLERQVGGKGREQRRDVTDPAVAEQPALHRLGDRAVRASANGAMSRLAAAGHAKRHETKHECTLRERHGHDYGDQGHRAPFARDATRRARCCPTRVGDARPVQ